MFTGIDEVDWATLRHAHGSAEDMPGWLRALASTDAAERAAALDRMYGAVHHQGRVYDSTLACVPFLFALAARADVPDRGCIVELLVSIGGLGGSHGTGGVSGVDGAGGLSGTEGVEGGVRSVGGGEIGVSGAGGSHGIGDIDGESPADEGPDRRAREAVRAGAASFARLAADPDPAVRRTAAGAVVRFLDEPLRVLELLRQRLHDERDDCVLLALTEALGLFAHRYPAHADTAMAHLADHSGPSSSPALRLAALGQLALHAPGRLPVGLVPTVVRLLRERSARRVLAREHRGPDTLVGRIRRLRPSDEEGAVLLRTLHGALGDRVMARLALLAGQLTSPDPVDRCNAVWMSAGLFRGWRGDHGGVVRLLGTQLGTEEDRLRDAAVSVLAELFALAVPAADDLHALVATRPDLWTHRWERCPPTLGGPLKALTRAGDPRAVPALAQLLAGPAAPVGLGFEIAHLGRAAAPLAPALRHRLGRVPLASPTAARLAAPLLTAVRATGDTDAVPELLRLLSDPPGGPEARDAVVGQVIGTLAALGAAEQARPLLGRLLDTRHAAVAAGALWSADGDVSAVLPVLVRELTQADPVARHHAVRALGSMGPAARAALPALRRLARSGPARERVPAACALWHITAEPGPVRPVFRAAWAEDPRTRVPVARCLTTMGSAAAPLRDLVTSELDAPRRHMATGDGAYGSQDIPADEELIRLCREVLASL
ncbi:HEAT repeat domain-containing protein [Streptomyces dangxiongensis]|uniref:HEAT repeat domain-containing protein n=1 Tax=Streptomyces dangxiongensis TaxID=1442032 RepID=A0A3G2JPN6_9ACTN|nr:HEAT repeat domain-containing protein [Streptomyces dangxiongensis]AYN42649.1 HEAT repeat domain-containing protein [Streptomyces dangxiongensis]